MDEVIKPSSEVIVVSMEDNHTVTMVDPKTRGILESYSDESSVMSRGTVCVAAKTGHIIGFQSQKTILNIWNFNTKKVFLRVSCSEKITATCVSHSELYFAAASSSGFVYIWETLSGELIRKYKPHAKKVNCISFSYDDGLLITAADDGIVQVYLLSTLLAGDSKMKQDIANGKTECKPKYSLIGHSEKINSITQSRGVLGKLYTASSDKSIIIWDLAKGCRLGQVSCESEVVCVVVDSCEEFVVAGCKNGNIYKVKVNDNLGYKLEVDEVTQTPSIEKSRLNKHTVFRGHTAEVVGVQLYEEAKQFVSAGRDGLLIFWDFEGQIVKTLNLNGKPIANLCVFRRPKEFEQKNPLLAAKKPLSFKAFHRYEEAQSNGQQGSLVGESAKEHRFLMPSISKAIKKELTRKPLSKAAFVAATAGLLKQPIHSRTIETENATGCDETVVQYSQQEIKEILAENTRLKALNHALFNNHATNTLK